MDILLAHGYFLYDDPHELKVMKPYPPLGILHISAYLKRQGFDVGIFDATFSEPDAFEALLRQERPPVVGLYTNMLTKFNVLCMITLSRHFGARVILGGPEPPYYAQEYLDAGADVIVRGEGELPWRNSCRTWPATAWMVWTPSPESRFGARTARRSRLWPGPS